MCTCTRMCKNPSVVTARLSFVYRCAYTSVRYTCRVPVSDVLLVLPIICIFGPFACGEMYKVILIRVGRRRKTSARRCCCCCCFRQHFRPKLPVARRRQPFATRRRARVVDGSRDGRARGEGVLNCSSQIVAVTCDVLAPPV